MPKKGLLFILTLALSFDSHAVIPTLKVRVKKALDKVFVSGTDLKREIPLKADTKVYEGRKLVKFDCRKGLQSKGLPNKPILLASLSSPTGLISLKKEKYQGKLHVITTKGKENCDVVHETSVEDYISTLLSKEMNAVWPIEALKAQAVAARTYALHKKVSKQVSKENGFEAHYDLESSEKHQVAGSFFDATMSTHKAALSTKGLVLLNPSKKLTPVFFHAKCGGKTLRPDQVWENVVEGYQSVPCPFCDSHGKKSWSSGLTLKRFKKFLVWASENNYASTGLSSALNKKIKIAPDKFFRRNLRVYLDDKVYLVEKSHLRRYFGRVVFPSNNYLFKLNKKNKISVWGKGLGHGVGMCQLGALDLAKKGWGYKKILAHYFPKHKLAKAY